MDSSNNAFSWGVISKYRTELMGVACLMIMFFHNVFVWGEDIISKVLKVLANSGNIGVDIFLFLSGIGLFYSFSRNNRILSFYKKRLTRILIPYFFIVGSYYLWLVLSSGKGFLDFLKYFFQINLFMIGDRAVWYITASFFFYLLFPVIFYFQNNDIKIGKVTVRHSVTTVLFCFTYLLFLILFAKYQPDIYANIEIMISRFLIFIVGGVFGKIVKDNKVLPPGTVVGCGLCFLFTVGFLFRQCAIPNFWERIIYIPLSICLTIFFAGVFFYADRILSKKLKTGFFKIFRFFGIVLWKYICFMFY